MTETLCCCVFFFSSRRRHTRFDCDWSSDVCSSDLEDGAEREDLPAQGIQRRPGEVPPRQPSESCGGGYVQVLTGEEPARDEGVDGGGRSGEGRGGEEGRARGWPDH